MQENAKTMNNSFLFNSPRLLRSKTMIANAKKRIARLVRGLAVTHKNIVCDIKKNEAKNA